VIDILQKFLLPIQVALQQSQFLVFMTHIILLSTDITKINQNNHLQDSVSSISDVGSVDDPGLNTAIAAVFWRWAFTIGVKNRRWLCSVYWGHVEKTITRFTRPWLTCDGMSQITEKGSILTEFYVYRLE